LFTTESCLCTVLLAHHIRALVHNKGKDKVSPRTGHKGPDGE